MEFTIRKLNNKDYETILLKWWKDWRLTPVPKDFLPDNGKGGYIVYDKETPVCAGFMYVTNSKVGYVINYIQHRVQRQKRKKRCRI